MQRPHTGKDGSRRSATNAGRVAGLLFVPHLALGAWLLIVPDHVAFLETQLVTLTHVGLALLTVPVILLLGWRHARQLGTRPRETLLARWSKWLLTAAGIGAVVTGTAAFFAYAHAAATLHAVFGVALGVPLAAHLLLASRRLTGAIVVALTVASTAWAIHGESAPPSQPVEPIVPPPDYRLRSASLYEDSSWCFRCHRTEYDEWRQSTHAFTFSRAAFTSKLEQNPEPLGHTLAEAGSIVTASGPIDLKHGITTASACAACHAPIAFYSDAGDPAPGSPANEGVGCAFCHTLRAIRNDGHFPDEVRKVRDGIHEADIKHFVASQPYYVSAPETVRRYLFQGSANPAAGWLGNMLIRWRPSMHRHDYASAISHTDLSCRGCHPDAGSAGDVALLQQHGLLKLAAGQERTTLSGAPAEARCVECHMAPEPGFFWEAPKPSHLFLGGNVDAARRTSGDDLAARAHAFAKGSVTFSVAQADLQGTTVSVAVKIRNDRIPHAFPAFEAGGARFAWVQVKALDASGGVLADTQTRDNTLPDSLKVTVDSVIGPREERTIRMALSLPPGSHPAEIVANLYKSLDPEPIAVARLPLVPR